jgi:hypothetical protein
MATDRDFEQGIYSHQKAQAAEAALPLFETYADRVMRRVDEVIAGKACKWQPTLADTTLLTLLRNHQGKNRAVALGALCERMHVTPRTVKEIVQELRLNFGVQLGASRDGEAGGYYLIATAEESLDSTEPMLHQAVTMLKVVCAMRGGRSAIQQVLTQLSLDLNRDADQEVTHG